MKTNLFFLLLIRYTPSLLTLAKVVMTGIVILVFVLSCTVMTGCSVTHDKGELPHVEINNPIADKTKVKIRKDKIIIKMKWYF